MNHSVRYYCTLYEHQTGRLSSSYLHTHTEVWSTIRCCGQTAVFTLMWIQQRLQYTAIAGVGVTDLTQTFGLVLYFYLDSIIDINLSAVYLLYLRHFIWWFFYSQLFNQAINWILLLYHRQNYYQLITQGYIMLSAVYPACGYMHFETFSFGDFSTHNYLIHMSFINWSY